MPNSLVLEAAKVIIFSIKQKIPQFIYYQRYLQRGYRILIFRISAFSLFFRIVFRIMLFNYPMWFFIDERNFEADIKAVVIRIFK
jgi:hypothetical protein